MSLFNSELGFERISELLSNRHARFHFIGICGVGMAPLAELLCRRGYSVSGSDRALTDSASQLTDLGARVISGHSATGAAGADVIVYSTAIDDKNPEYIYALEHGLPVISRAELLGTLMREYTHRIAVAGSHGKSSTVAMLYSVFERAGLMPTAVSGAPLSSARGALSVGGNDYFICESCEYKDAFLRLCPTSVLITNAELDHTDYFDSYESLLRSFAAFRDKARDYAFLCADDRGALSLMVDGGCPIITYGTSESADYRYEITVRSDTGWRFNLYKRGNELGEISLSVVGEANVANAAATVAIADTYGIRLDIICLALADFRGIPRRLEYLGNIEGRAIYYDYAHHPTEIFNTLATVKRLHGECTAVFRPHTYSRTAALFDGFVRSLSLAERSVILDVYAAREEPIPGIDAYRLAECIGDASCRLDFDEVLPYVLRHTPGAVVLMGAGEMDSVREDFLGMINSQKTNNNTDK